MSKFATNQRNIVKVISKSVRSKGWEGLRVEISSMAKFPSSAFLVSQIEVMLPKKLASCGHCGVK